MASNKLNFDWGDEVTVLNLHLNASNLGLKEVFVEYVQLTQRKLQPNSINQLVLNYTWSNLIMVTLLKFQEFFWTGVGLG